MFDVKTTLSVILSILELFETRWKCVLCSSMSTKMEVPLQSELTECLVNARHWLLCIGANLTGDKCWGLRQPQSCWRNMPITNSICCRVCSIQFNCSVMSDSLQPHGLQHTRPPCPSPTPWVYSNSCPVSHAIQPSHLLSSPFPPAFSVSQHQGLFNVSSSYQMAKVLACHLQHSVLPMNIQEWFVLGLTGLISL